LTGEFIFEPRQYFDNCHASTLVEVDGGVLLCAWFAGTREKHPDTAIWLSRLEGTVWREPVRVAKVGPVAHWNPVLFRDDAYGTFLFFKVGEDSQKWSTYWMRSDDGGLNWSEPVELVDGDVGGRGPVKNKPIVLSDGSWLAPASTEMSLKAGWFSFADRSEDGGHTWSRSEAFSSGPTIPSGTLVIQPTFWESKPGLVTALMRTSGGFIAQARSSDFGKTWGPMCNSAMPNNNSGIDAARVADGSIMLACNPVAGDWGARTPLILAKSVDGGSNWETVVVLEDSKGEYSYPSIVATASGFAVSYTWQRTRIRVRMAS